MNQLLRNLTKMVTMYTVLDTAQISDFNPEPNTTWKYNPNPTPITTTLQLGDSSSIISDFQFQRFSFPISSYFSHYHRYFFMIFFFRSEAKYLYGVNFLFTKKNKLFYIPDNIPQEQEEGFFSRGTEILPINSNLKKTTKVKI